MADAKRDFNRVTTLVGVSSVDGTTIVPIQVNPVTGRTLVDLPSGSSGTVTSVGTGAGLTGGTITTAGTISLDSKLAPLDTLGTALQSVRVNAGATALEYYTPSGSTGTVTSVSVATANGFSGTVATATTTPAITIIAGAITPTTVNGITISGSGSFALGTKNLTISNTLTLAGTDGTIMTFPTTSATLARTDATNTFTGIQTFSTPIATASVATMTASVGGGVPTPPNNTTTFLRGDGTFAAPTSSATTVLTYIPVPAWFVTSPSGAGNSVSSNMATNTTANVGQISLPFKMVANAVSIRVGSVSVQGNVIISMFSEDGQTRLFSITADSGAAAGILTFTLSAVTINPGNYWIMIQPSSTTNFSPYVWGDSSAIIPFSTTFGLQFDVSGKVLLEGTYTVTASTAPSTLTLASITKAIKSCLVVRFDN
jgi:hypothetical protein